MGIQTGRSDTEDLRETDLDLLEEGDPPGEDWFIVVDDEDVEELVEARVPKCPKPTRWALQGTAVKATGKWMRVSNAYWAKEAAIRHTFRVQRSVTWGTVVESSVSGSLKLIEAEVGVKLERSVTITTAEQISYVIPKGKIMALYAAPAYVKRTYARTVWGSAMCNEVRQRAVIWTPASYVVKVDFA